MILSSRFLIYNIMLSIKIKNGIKDGKCDLRWVQRTQVTAIG